MGHARALLSLGLDEQAMLCQKISNKKNVDEEQLKILEVALDCINNDKDISVLESQFDNKLLNQSIQHKTKGNGILKINYPNLESLDKVLKKLK